MKLNKISKITGKIVLESGLHIGAGDTELRIGGTDNPVVKHPYTNEPYIPGSSLKGKVRSLLELRSGLLAFMRGRDSGKPLSTAIFKENLDKHQKAKAIRILKLFGVSGADDQENLKIGPARASFADSFLNEKSKKMVKVNQQSYFEVKSENSINRIKGTARDPRFTERVVAGLKFDFAINLKEMEGDKDEALLDTLLEGLKLLEHDALGGSGSRGYGRVHFEFDDGSIAEKFDGINLFS